MPPHPVARSRLTTIAPAADGRFAEPILADRYGGPIAAGEEQGELRTRQGWFDVTFEAHDEPHAPFMRGVVRVDAEAASPAVLLWRQVARVLVREHGF